MPKLDYLQYIAVKGVFTYLAGQISSALQQLRNRTSAATNRLQAVGFKQDDESDGSNASSKGSPSGANQRGMDRHESSRQHDDEASSSRGESSDDESSHGLAAAALARTKVSERGEWLCCLNASFPSSAKSSRLVASQCSLCQLMHSQRKGDTQLAVPAWTFHPIIAMCFVIRSLLEFKCCAPFGYIVLSIAQLPFEDCFTETFRLQLVACLSL